MPPLPDGRPRVSEVAICRIAGVDRNRRRPWVDHGLLPGRGNDGYGELDAAELATLRVLVAELQFERARLAWKGVQPALRDALFVGSLFVVFDDGRSEGVLFTEASELFAFATRPGRYQVVDVTSAVKDARVGFRNTYEAQLKGEASTTQASTVQQLRKKSVKPVV